MLFRSEGKTISRILQIIENDILETYFEYFINIGLIKPRNKGYEVAFIFDGLQLPINDLLLLILFYYFSLILFNLEMRSSFFPCAD